MQWACTTLSSVAHPALQYFSTPSHEQHNFFLGGGVAEHELSVSIFSTTFFSNISHSRKK